LLLYVEHRLPAVSTGLALVKLFLVGVAARLGEAVVTLAVLAL
jgi:hypothetical protein